MAEYSKIARGSFVSNGNPKTIYLPFTPAIITAKNITAQTAQRNNSYTDIYWDASINIGGGAANNINTVDGALGVLAVVGTAVNGITVFSSGLSNQFGPQQPIASATKAAQAVFTVNGHGYQVGDWVVFEGLYQVQYTTGMPQLDGPAFELVAVTTNTFTINWNTNQTNYTALSSPPSSFVRKVLYPNTYFPGVSVISAITNNGSSITVQTIATHNLSVGSVVSFRVTLPWGAVQLYYNQNIPGSVLYGTVTQVVNNFNVVVALDATGVNAFTTNVPVSSVHGLTFPQMVAAGDINSGGGIQTDARTGALVQNGPTINGAFLNNTSRGFIIGSAFMGLSGDTMSWYAIAPDITVNG